MLARVPLTQQGKNPNQAINAPVHHPFIAFDHDCQARRVDLLLVRAIRQRFRDVVGEVFVRVEELLAATISASLAAERRTGA